MPTKELAGVGAGARGRFERDAATAMPTKELAGVGAGARGRFERDRDTVSGSSGTKKFMPEALVKPFAPPALGLPS
jgi:hypothetical protein